MIVAQTIFIRFVKMYLYADDYVVKSSKLLKNIAALLLMQICIINDYLF